MEAKKQIKRFDLKGSSYTICDGTNHYRMEINIKKSLRGRKEDSCYVLCPCDNAICDKAMIVSVKNLHTKAQEVLGLLIPVPKDCLLIVQYRNPYRYLVLRGGDMVTQERWESGKVIRPGETVDVYESRQINNAYQKVRLTLSNKNGKLTIADSTESPALSRRMVPY